MRALSASVCDGVGEFALFRSWVLDLEDLNERVSGYIGGAFVMDNADGSTGFALQLRSKPCFALS